MAVRKKTHSYTHAKVNFVNGCALPCVFRDFKVGCFAEWQTKTNLEKWRCLYVLCVSDYIGLCPLRNSVPRLLLDVLSFDPKPCKWTDDKTDIDLESIHYLPDI